MCMCMCMCMLGCNNNKKATEEFRKQEEERIRVADKKWENCNFDSDEAKSVLSNNIDKAEYHIISIKGFGTNIDNCSVTYIIELMDIESKEKSKIWGTVQKTYSGYIYEFH